MKQTNMAPSPFPAVGSGGFLLLQSEFTNRASSDRGPLYHLPAFGPAALEMGHFPHPSLLGAHLCFDNVLLQRFTRTTISQG